MARAKAKAAAAISIPVVIETPEETPIALERSDKIMRVVGGLTVLAFAVLFGGMLYVSWVNGSSPNAQVATPVYSDEAPQ